MCGHKERYHSQDVNSQKYVCRGAYCECYEFRQKCNKNQCMTK